jgi:hypothetical protein
MDLIMNNSLLRSCFVILVGLMLIALGFIMSAVGIQAAIRGDYDTLYIAAMGLVFIFVAVFLFMAYVRRYNSYRGGPLMMHPPPFNEGEGFERDNV